MLDRLKAQARALKREVLVVYLAAKDPRTPWYARGLVLLIVAYALSPIDLIPDFVPVLGYLDDLILIPGGIWLAIRMIPPEVLVDAHSAAASSGVDRNAGRLGTIIIIVLWLVVLIFSIYLFLRITKRI
jgi:uncharacterized membrane protein YkvA (DUF1232 family)